MVVGGDPESDIAPSGAGLSARLVFHESQNAQGGIDI